MPEECAPYEKKGQVVKMTPGIMRMLERTNDRINARIWYVSDKRQYGRADYWNYPSENRGDCEDYAIAKRRDLIERGWPASALLIATAYTETGVGHAVLVARTTDGDFILDNRFSNVKIWHELPYRWLAIQSSSYPGRFDRIQRRQTTQPATGAGGPQ
jgi:predicted transglutaminase-like cysteine proteinase